MLWMGRFPGTFVSYAQTMQLLEHNTAERTASVQIYGRIGSWPLRASNIRFELGWINGKVDTVYFNIHSVGGNLDEANGIMAVVREFNSSVKMIARIQGLCASAAASLLTVFDRVECSKHAVVMIHSPRSGTYGPAEELESTAEMLRVYESVMCQGLAEKTGKSEEEIMDLLRKETWMTPAQAMDFGLVDEIIDMPKVKGHVPDPEASSLSGHGKFVDAVYHSPTGLWSKSKQVFMKDEIARVLGVDSNLPDSEILSRVKAEVDKLKSLQAEIAHIRKEKEEEEQTARKNLIDAAIEDGRITAEAREHYEDLPLAKVRGMFDHMKPQKSEPIRPDIEGSLKGKGENYNGLPQDYQGKKLGWWMRNHPEALSSLPESHPSVYAELTKGQEE